MQKQVTTVPIARRVPPIVIWVWFVVFQILIVGVAFAGGFFFYEWRYSLPQTSEITFPVLKEAYQLLENNAVFNLPDAKALEYGMIRGMLVAVNDPYTVFVEPPQHELQTDELQGRYGGIGARIERDAENFAYLYPLPNSPSLAAGLQNGDRLLAIEGQPVTAETTNDQIQAAIRGPVGEKLTITVGRPPDYTPIQLTIERGEVPLPSVAWNLAPDQPKVGIIHIHIIANTTPDEVLKGVQELKALGAEHFVIDVRSNGGGLVEAGVNLARLFLKDGNIIQEQYRGRPVKTYSMEKPGELADLPMVVLVNHGTASAAEIFAGAIQGQHRAPIVGIPTYGKDTIQLVFSLEDGSSLHVTSAHWWVPGLEPKIGGHGLQPDVLLDEKTDDNQAVQKAIETVLK